MTLLGLLLVANCTGPRSGVDDTVGSHTPSNEPSDETSNDERGASEGIDSSSASTDASNGDDTTTDPLSGSEANLDASSAEFSQRTDPTPGGGADTDAATPGPSQGIDPAVPDGGAEELPYDDLPRFHLELQGEWVADRELSPEGLLVLEDRLTIADPSGLLRFTREGTFLSGFDSSFYSGVDAGYFHRQDGASLFQMVTVWRNFASWSGDWFWEDFSDTFHDPRRLSGVTLERANGGTTLRYYITDRNAPSVVVVDISSEKAELLLPGVVPEGVNHSEEHGLLVADARGRRLLHVAEDLSEVLATADLPEPYDQSIPTGLSFFQGQLYVCFRGENRIAIFDVGDE